jgi:8-oxo-dGTP pyrophosphatase MutT (NUDIX family)
MAFPGGRNEAGEADQDTVVREVREEVGLDLNSDDYVKLGCLDDRELTSLLGGKPIMILSTFGKYLAMGWGELSFKPIFFSVFPWGDGKTYGTDLPIHGVLHVFFLGGNVDLFPS